MKLSINLLTISLVAFFFSACGDGSNTTSGGPTKLSNADMEVDSYSQLPSCAEKREGKTAYVADQEQGYVCQGGEWFKSNAVEIYSSENLSFLENTSSTSNSLSVSKRTMTDSRDGKTYKTVKIGMQTWMEENLNYKTAGSYCYNDDPANCTIYGRLYTWNAAMKACPSGWHLPSYAEFEALIDFVGGESFAYTKLRSTYGWSDVGNSTDDLNGTDAFGFTAKPAGCFCGDGGFYENGTAAVFWSSTEDDPYIDKGLYVEPAFYMDFDIWAKGDRMLWTSQKTYGFSVRCLKD